MKIVRRSICDLDARICLPRPDCFDDDDCSDDERCDRGYASRLFAVITTMMMGPAAGRCIPPFFCLVDEDCPIRDSRASITNVSEQVDVKVTMNVVVVKVVLPVFARRFHVRCQRDDDCPAGRQCEFGFCIPQQGYRSNDDCPQTGCKYRQCIPNPNLCRNDAE